MCIRWHPSFKSWTEDTKANKKGSFRHVNVSLHPFIHHAASTSLDAGGITTASPEPYNRRDCEVHATNVNDRYHRVKPVQNVSIEIGLTYSD